MRPNNREMKVLRELCLGTIESAAHFAGIGPKTFEAMLAKNWIVEAYCSTYDVDGYQITPEGKAVFEQYA